MFRERLLLSEEFQKVQKGRNDLCLLLVLFNLFAVGASWLVVFFALGVGGLKPP